MRRKYQGYRAAPPCYPGLGAAGRQTGFAYSGSQNNNLQGGFADPSEGLEDCEDQMSSGLKSVSQQCLKGCKGSTYLYLVLVEGTRLGLQGWRDVGSVAPIFSTGQFGAPRALPQNESSPFSVLWSGGYTITCLK